MPRTFCIVLPVLLIILVILLMNILFITSDSSYLRHSMIHSKLILESSNELKLNDNNGVNVGDLVQKLLSKVDQIDAKYCSFEPELRNTLSVETAQYREMQVFNRNIKHIFEELSSVKTQVSSASKSSADRNEAFCDDTQPGGKRIISYTLYGPNAEGYGRFIADVATEAANIEPYNTFTIRIYVGATFSMESRERYKRAHKNIRFCDVRRMPKLGDVSRLIGTVWRFLPLADPTIDVLCSRDLDSPLLQRGGNAVTEWLQSDKYFHMMRDRSVHMTPILGGLWCARPSKNMKLSKELFDAIIEKARLTSNNEHDQEILRKHIYPRVKNVSMQHDSYFCESFLGAKPFPTQRLKYFVGCVRDCDGSNMEICPQACRPKDHPDWKHC